MAEIVEKSATIDDDTLRVRFSVRHARHEAGRWYHDRVEIIGSRPGRSIEKLFELDADRQVAADLKEPTTVVRRPMTLPTSQSHRGTTRQSPIIDSCLDVGGGGRASSGSALCSAGCG